jgi:hypothetical protein
MVEGLLSSVQGLCAIVRAKLSGDPVPVSLLVQEDGSGDRSGSRAAEAAPTLPRHSLLALFLSSADFGEGEAAPGARDLLGSRVPVVDRPALVQAVNSMVSSTVKLRLDVTEAMATSLGSECAMQ